MNSHFKRHMRFYLAAALGLIAGTVVAGLFPRLAIVAGADIFFAVYLLLMTALVVRATPEKAYDLDFYQSFAAEVGWRLG